MTLTSFGRGDARVANIDALGLWPSADIARDLAPEAGSALMSLPRCGSQVLLQGLSLDLLLSAVSDHERKSNMKAGQERHSSRCNLPLLSCH